MSSSTRPFQVDLRGVVDLLSRHIYSTPQVYIRELLQNGRDAIIARHSEDPTAPQGEIRITPAAPGGDFEFRDNGIGMTGEEAAELLATVGLSSKKHDLADLRREGYLGQFGIGLLSAFMVADIIVVRSRSARGGDPIEWVGSSEGTFTVRTLTGNDARDTPVGSHVRLTPRPDDATLCGPEAVRRLVSSYGRYLPHSLLLRTGATWDRLNIPAPFAMTDPDQLADLAQDVIGGNPLDIIPLRVPATGTTGVAFVLPYAPPMVPRPSHRFYLGGMLLNERLTEILPEWAFFVRGVITSDDLRPTASREHLIDSDGLDLTRDEIGNQLRAWILDMASTRPDRFEQFLAVHSLALKSMALADDELATVVVPHLEVESSVGELTVGALIARNPHVRYTKTVDEFRQIAAIVPPDLPVANGGYVHDADLLQRLPDLFTGVTVEQLNISDLLDELEAPALSDRMHAVDLETRASAVLKELDCTAVARIFHPHDLSALYVADPEVLRRIDRHHARGQAPPVWSGILDGVEEFLNDNRAESGRAPATSQLCLNWANPLVRELSAMGDELVFDRSIRLLYVQALLAGHHPLRPEHRSMLATALTGLIHLSIGLDGRPA